VYEEGKLTRDERNGRPRKKEQVWSIFLPLFCSVSSPPSQERREMEWSTYRKRKTDSVMEGTSWRGRKSGILCMKRSLLSEKEGDETPCQLFNGEGDSVLVLQPFLFERKSIHSSKCLRVYFLSHPFRTFPPFLRWRRVRETSLSMSHIVMC